ncbi:hypothetical protein ABFS83_11G083600 [Erythranthe nasuta]
MTKGFHPKNFSTHRHSQPRSPFLAAVYRSSPTAAVNNLHSARRRQQPALRSPPSIASPPLAAAASRSPPRPSPSPSRRKIRPSGVWNFFQKVIDDGKQKSKCKRCGQLYVSSGTTNLKRHLESICPFRSCKDVVEFDQYVFREKVAKATIRDNYPFNFVEHEGIREVFSYLNPKAQHLSRNNSKSDVLMIYEREKEKLREMLESVCSRMCLTSDLWSSIVSNGYMAVTAHYIDNNWVLQKGLLIFRHLPPPHDGQSVGEKLISFLQEWGIERKIFTLTFDNASYDNGVIDLLKNHLRLKNSLVCNGEFMHVKCGAHILNLVVHSGLIVINESIGKIMDSVKYVRGSETRTLKFVECVKQLGLKASKKLVQDMPVRWNSTNLMLESALVYKLAFQQLKLVDINYKWCPSDEEWERVEKIAKFFRPFFEMTELFSGQHYPTANHYFPNVWRIQRLIHDEMTSGDSIISAMARRMKPKFDKYWECYSTVLSFAIILDPRYKLPFVEFAYGKLDQSQLEKYLNQPLLDRKQFPNLNVLDYWKGNATTYPEVAQMARDILSIPITTVASESTFSHGGRIIGKFRSSILPKNAEAILCARDWLEGLTTTTLTL